MSKEITNDLINNFENDFNSSKANKIAARAAQENGIFKASQNLQTKIDLDPTFSIEIDTGKVANQKQSGRCWMFSALNTMRHSIQKNFKLRTLNYLKITLTSGTNLKSQTGSLKM